VKTCPSLSLVHLEMTTGFPQQRVKHLHYRHETLHELQNNRLTCPRYFSPPCVHHVNAQTLLPCSNNLSPQTCLKFTNFSVPRTKSQLELLYGSVATGRGSDTSCWFCEYRWDYAWPSGIKNIHY
jgi:hypothetical protein